MAELSKLDSIMVDIETLSSNSNAVIVSISAVAFNLATGKMGEEFCMGLDIEQQVQLGSDLSANTLLWWLGQSSDAQSSLLSTPRQDVIKVLKDFNEYINRVAKSEGVTLKQMQLWGNGATFDNVIIKNLYQAAKIPFILQYWADKDVRTLVYLSDLNVYKEKFTGIKHNGIDDCKHQIKYCHKAFKKLLNFAK